MKNLFAVFALSLLVPLTSVAQKFGYVDTDYVLKHMAEYSDAQAELNRLSAQWQEEIEAKYEAIRLLEEAYQAEKILLTQEMRQRREEEIRTKRREAQELQKQKYGVEGELFQKREELIKPIQDQIYEAIEEVASSRGYMVIFDKSNQSNMLYTNPKYDLSEDVIKKMGYKPGEIIEDDKGDGDDRDNNGGNARGAGGAARGAQGSGGDTQMKRK